jgi:hypothetical protein
MVASQCARREKPTGKPRSRSPAPKHIYHRAFRRYFAAVKCVKTWGLNLPKTDSLTETTSCRVCQRCQQRQRCQQDAEMAEILDAYQIQALSNSPRLGTSNQTDVFQRPLTGPNVRPEPCAGSRCLAQTVVVVANAGVENGLAAHLKSQPSRWSYRRWGCASLRE